MAITEPSQDAVEARLKRYTDRNPHMTDEEIAELRDEIFDQLTNEFGDVLAIERNRWEQEVRERLAPLLDDYTEAVEAFCRGERGASLRVNELEKRILAIFGEAEPFKEPDEDLYREIEVGGTTHRPPDPDAAEGEGRR